MTKLSSGLTGLCLAASILLATTTVRSEKAPQLDPIEAVALVRKSAPRLATHRLALEYSAALDVLRGISRRCPDPEVQRLIARHAAPLNRENDLLLLLIAAGEAGRDLKLPFTTVRLRPAGVDGYRLVGSNEVQPWRTLRTGHYLRLLGQLDLSARHHLDVALFCLHRGLEEAGALAIRTARAADLELKAESDLLIAAHRGEPVPRGGYEFFRGRYVPLDQRDVGVALVQIAAELEGHELTPPEARLLADVRLAMDRLSAKTAPALLAALALRLRTSLRTDEARVRALFVSFAAEGLARRRLAQQEKLDEHREEMLELIENYDKPQQPEVNEARRVLMDLWGAATSLRRDDERPLRAMTPLEARRLVDLMVTRERALDRIWFYLSAHASDIPRPDRPVAADPDRATLHVLPGQPNRGLEEVFWLALNVHADRHAYVLERGGEVLRRFADLRAWERMVLRDVFARNVRAYNRVMATSLGPNERECIEVTNDYRVALGLRPLEVDERVVQAARGHSQEMFDLGYFGHISPVERNKTPTDRNHNAGYNGGAAENCYVGSSSGRAAFTAWYNSPGHHRNMITPMPHIGVGHDRGATLWTMALSDGDFAWRLLHRDLAPDQRKLLEREIDQAVAGKSEMRARVLARGGAALGPVARRALGHGKVDDDAFGPIELLVALAEQERNPTLIRAGVDALMPFLLSARREIRDTAFEILCRLIPWKLDPFPGMPARDRQQAVKRLRVRIEKNRERIGVIVEAAPRVERPRTTSKAPSIKTPLKPLTRKDRLRLARKHGGSTRTEQAVERGLKWLAAHQSANGSFAGQSFRSSCRTKPGCTDPGQQQFEIGLTGLTLLAFLATGNTPELGKYASNVRDGVDFLMYALQDFGKFASTSSGYMYSHALATQALLEAYAYTADPEIGIAARRALDFLIYAQHGPTGGWRYQSKEPGDTSVTGWAVLTLHSARKAGMDVVGLAGVRRFIDRVSDPCYYRVGYQKPFDRPPTVNRLCAVGMLIRQVLGTSRSSSRLRVPAERLAADPPMASRPDPYYWYYGTLAMFQMGGDLWRTWNEALVPAVLETQDTKNAKSVKERGCAFGSWAPRGEYTAEGGRLYTTALHVLILTVYYRYDIFPEQRPGAFTGQIDELVRPHLDRLGDESNQIGREVAKRTLEEKFGHGVAPLLIAELQTAGHGPRRDDLAEVLANVATDEHVPAIVMLMEGSHGLVLEHLSRGLVDAATIRNRKCLLANLRHDHPRVRGHCAEALGRVGGESAIAPLLEMQVEERDDRVRKRVADALRALTERGALDRFLDAAKGLSPRDRNDLREVFGIMSGSGILEDLWIRSEKRTKLRRRVLELLTSDRRAACVSILILGLESDSLDVRKDALRLLKSLSGQDFGFDPAAADRVRREALALWTAWWRESQEDRFSAGKR